MKIVVILFFILAASLAQADCPPLKVAGYVVSIGQDNVTIKSPTGESTVLDIEESDRVACESLKVSAAKSDGLPLVEFTYYPGASGTLVIIDDENFVLIDLKEQKFATEPVTLEEVQRRPLHEDRTVQNSVAWKKKNGLSVLEKTDLETKETTQIWPSLTPVPTETPKSSPTPGPSPAAGSTNPVGTSEI